jgi:hypothetical protein
VTIEITEVPLSVLAAMGCSLPSCAKHTRQALVIIRAWEQYREDAVRAAVTALTMGQHGTAEAPEISESQHCTSEACHFTMSHTAAWCGYPQTRRCECHWCYGGTAVRRRAYSDDPAV